MNWHCLGSSIGTIIAASPVPKYLYFGYIDWIAPRIIKHNNIDYFSGIFKNRGCGSNAVVLKLITAVVVVVAVIT